MADHLDRWFTSKGDLKETLENIINSLWEQSVILPLLRLVEEGAPETGPLPGMLGCMADWNQITELGL